MRYQLRATTNHTGQLGICPAARILSTQPADQDITLLPVPSSKRIGLLPGPVVLGGL